MTELNWRWITLMLVVPPPISVSIAYLLWRRRETIFGNLAGSMVIFASTLAMILREYVEVDRVTKQCLDAGFTCWPEPSAFTRFAIYAGIGLFEVVVLFAVSLKVEQRIRNRDYAPEWR